MRIITKNKSQNKCNLDKWIDFESLSDWPFSSSGHGGLF